MLWGAEVTDGGLDSGKGNGDDKKALVAMDVSMLTLHPSFSPGVFHAAFPGICHQGVMPGP